MMILQSYLICILSVLSLDLNPSVQGAALDFESLMAEFESFVIEGIDTYLFVGEELHVPCTLNAEMLQNNWTARDIFYKFSQPKTDPSYLLCLDRSLVRIINSSTVMLTIRNVTLRESGLYSCHVSLNNTCTSLINTTKTFTDDLLVGHTDDIDIQYKPQNVTDFKCTIYDWNGHMKCTWSHPVTYVKDDYTGSSDTFVVIKEGELGNLTLCPENTSVSCLWPKDHLIQKDTYYITVEVWNAQKAIHTSQVFTVHADQIVQLAPVKDVSVKTLSNRCLKLLWTHGSDRAKVFRIIQQKNGDPGYDVVADNGTSTTYKMCNYEPFSVYTFAVDCRPQGIKGYWSDPQVIHVLTTPKSAFRSGLVIAKGSDATACIAELRNVTTHWQEVDRWHKSGIIDSYSVKINGRVLARIPTGKPKHLKAPGTCVNAVIKTVILG